MPVTSEFYLGDGVYVELDALRRVVLFTRSGENNQVDNRVILDGDTLECLRMWLDNLEGVSSR